MNAKNRLSNAERLGRWLGRRWRAYARGEQRMVGWLVAKGLSAGAAATLQWAAKLVVLAVLLYFTFLWTLVMVFLVAAARTIASCDLDEEPETEWRTGSSGFGLYRGDVRIDVGQPYDEDSE